LSSLDTNSSGPIPKWESHTSGTVTPVAFVEEDPALPSRFLACVSREVSARQLKPAFTEVSPLGAAVEICVANNVQAVKQADVVLLWSASPGHFPKFTRVDVVPSAVNHNLLTLS
jgi:pyrroline-5-carboxylate reductase